jgi:hypothetical protein
MIVGNNAIDHVSKLLSEAVTIGIWVSEMYK